MRNFVFIHFFLFAFIGLAVSGGAGERGPNAGKRLVLKTQAAYPRDKNAYTQGLIFHDGFLYESTGQYGQSSLRKVEIRTGKVLQSRGLKSDFFGEGLERVGDSLYQLTWREGLCFVYDLETLQYRKSFRYSGEGWGLACDGTHLILSDGTSTLRFYEPENFALQKRLSVVETDSQSREKPVHNINELEMVEGELWANIWKSDQIARINPKTGRVLGWINCSGFVPKEYREEHGNPRIAEHVLNGIAYDQETRTVYITGKNWPVLYEIRIDWE